MKVLIHSDNQIKVNAETQKTAEAEVDRALSRFEGRLTRVELHLRDLHGPRQGDQVRDKRCVIEARPAGIQPVSATDDANTVTDAIFGAANKMKRLLESTLGKQAAIGRETIRQQAL
jgi:hypothetical protein